MDSEEGSEGDTLGEFVEDDDEEDSGALGWFCDWRAVVFF